MDNFDTSLSTGPWATEALMRRKTASFGAPQELTPEQQAQLDQARSSWAWPADPKSLSLLPKADITAGVKSPLSSGVYAGLRGGLAGGMLGALASGPLGMSPVASGALGAALAGGYSGLSAAGDQLQHNAAVEELMRRGGQTQFDLQNSLYGAARPSSGY